MVFSASFQCKVYSSLITFMVAAGLCFIHTKVLADLHVSSVPLVLTIEPAFDRKPISPYIYGINIANWCSWYYMHTLEQRLIDAKVEVVRLGATNMERYNFKNNRMYNVISKKNEYLSLSWESFVDWTRNSLNAEPFLQASVFGNVASDSDLNSDGENIQSESYSHVQSEEELIEWVNSAGEAVRFWGIGNEPWIAWKRSDYPTLYSDAAHGDQVLNWNTSYDYYFNRFATIAKAIKSVNPDSITFGPTPANWWLYWFNDYSPLCPVTEPGGDARIDDPVWQVMTASESEFNQAVFPDRGRDPEIAGWEIDPNKSLPQYLQRMSIYESKAIKDSGTANGSERIANYMDLHRYIRCVTEYDAIQEPRGLFQEDFESWDMETLFSGVRTNILNRLNGAIASYYPGTLISFSEYGYFYWDGYPSIPQVSATTQIDYLGFFARGNVSLACNWYVGEPNQSGADLTHARRDSAMQAMFDEAGNPNPKYFAFYMMSNFFRGTSVKAESSDWDRFSVHACEDEKGDYVVFAVNKGVYDQTTGEYIHNQPAVSATIKFPASDKNLHLSRLFRYGVDDPYVIEMDSKEVTVGTQREVQFDFHPLAIYAFVFSGRAADDDSEEAVTSEKKTVLVTPETIYFRAYENGKITDDDATVFTHAIRITNAAQEAAPWSVMKNGGEKGSWLTIEGGSNSIDGAAGIIHGNLSGAAEVTDSVYLTVDRTALTPGMYETEIFVNTGSGQIERSAVRVIMDVVTSEENGEKRIADFETGSLAHTLNRVPPYSIGWWDGHGAPDDRNMPYLYDFYIEKRDAETTGNSGATDAIRDYGTITGAANGINRLGGQYCMKIEFDRSGGDTEAGKLYQSFGTYGHSSATSNWEGFDAFEFDIKTDTIDSTHTDLLMILSDQSGNKGKPGIHLTTHTDLMAVEDGPWQTIKIPLNGKFFDWRYPEGQNGAETAMDFANITQIEFVPWSADANKKGDIWLDNLRLTRSDGEQNHFPVAVIEKKKIVIRPGESVTLNGLQSYDPDQGAEIAHYQWISLKNLSDTEISSDIKKLSDSSIASPLFSSSDEGTYLFDLVVRDKDGLESRNIAQVMVTVSHAMLPDEGTVSIGGGSAGQGCFISTVIESDNGNERSSWILLLIIITLVAIATLLARPPSAKPRPNL